MRFTALLLGIVLAILAMGSIATASTYYDIVQGLVDNTTTATAWDGTNIAQTGADGWSYRTGAAVNPWAGLHGADFTFAANLSDYSSMGWEWSPGGGDWIRAWGAGRVSYGAQDAGQGLIGNSDETGAAKFGSAVGSAVGFFDGSQAFIQNVVAWTASQSGTADVAYTCYSAPNVAQYSVVTGCEFHLGLYHNGTVSQLNWCSVIGDSNSGADKGVSLTATGVSVAAGDSIVLLSRSANYNLYGTRQQNGSASGGITLTAGDVPEPGSLLALGSGLIGLVGFAVRRRK